MFINFQQLNNAGYEVNTEDKGISIEPKSHKNNSQLSHKVFDSLKAHTELSNAMKATITEELIEQVIVQDILRACTKGGRK